MNELLLVVSIAGQRAALSAADVHSVIEVDALTPTPRAPAHVAGLCALRSRVLTVIDCATSMEIGRDSESAIPRQAVVVEQDGHFYALRVDEVDDVTTAHSDILPVRTGLSAGWQRVSPGMVETPEGPLPLLLPAELIAGPRDWSREMRAA